MSAGGARVISVWYLISQDGRLHRPVAIFTFVGIDNPRESWRRGVIQDGLSLVRRLTNETLCQRISFK